MSARCPVCDGKGGWSRDTYRPRHKPEMPDAPWHRCPFCDGRGHVTYRWI